MRSLDEILTDMRNEANRCSGKSSEDWKQMDRYLVGVANEIGEFFRDRCPIGRISVDLDELKNLNENLVYLGDTPEQYHDAIVGVTYDSNHIIYDVGKFIELLVKEGMTYEEAEDWTSYNTARSIEYLHSECHPILIYSKEA